MMAIVEGMAAVLLVLGAVLTLLAAVGVLRLPDVYTRMSATSKAATLGVTGVLVAGALHFHESGVSQRAIATAAFLMLTAPVAAHMLGRAAWLSGVPFWSGTRVNQLDGRERRASQPESDPQPPRQ